MANCKKSFSAVTAARALAAALHTARVARRPASAAACRVLSCRPPSRAPARVPGRAAEAAARAVPDRAPRLTACPTPRALLCLDSSGLGHRQSAFLGRAHRHLRANVLRCALTSMLFAPAVHRRRPVSLLPFPRVPRAPLRAHAADASTSRVRRAFVVYLCRPAAATSSPRCAPLSALLNPARSLTLRSSLTLRAP